MCGRYSLHTEPEELARLFRLPIDEVLRMFDVAPRYNIAPTDTVLAVRAGRDRDRRPAALRWGLVPPWANNVSMGARTINARAETLLERPAFRDPFQEKRCLILADGFYEWRKLPTRRQPYLIRLKSGAPFAFAGLWDHWKTKKQEPIESCAIITTEPNELTTMLHDRMPVILPPHVYDVWLDPDMRDVDTLLGLLRPFAAQEMEMFPVNPIVNKVGNDGPECVEPVDLSQIESESRNKQIELF